MISLNMHVISLMLWFFLFAGAANLHIPEQTPMPSNDLADFLITVKIDENNENNVKFTCKEGCAWNALSFQCITGSCDQDVNDKGMMASYQNRDEPAGAFVFNIQRSESQILLSCDTGCAWKTLNFRQLAAGRAQAVDAHGMASPLR